VYILTHFAFTTADFLFDPEKIFLYTLPLTSFEEKIKQNIGFEILPVALSKLKLLNSNISSNKLDALRLLSLQNVIQVLRGIFQHEDFSDGDKKLSHPTLIQSVAIEVTSLISKREVYPIVLLYLL
jgi:hypothetical protein